MKSASEYLAYLVGQQPEPTIYQGQKRTKTGRVIDVAVAWNYRRNEKGSVIGFTSVITDITVARQIRELNDQL